MNSCPDIPQEVLESALDAIAAGDADCFLLYPDKAPVPAVGRGVKPLLQRLENDPDALCGAVLADKIIGKAAAMLAVLGGVRLVCALTASEPGLACLAAHGIPAEARVTVPQIENRTGTGLCPLEQSILEVEDPAEALVILKKTIAGLMAAAQH